MLSSVLLIALLHAGAQPAAAQPARTDCYGDALPPGALARFGTVRLTHGGPVQALAFSPDGKLLASASAGVAEPAIVLWDVASGQQVRRLERTLAARQLLFSHDGRLVARYDNAVCIWDNPADGKRVRIHNVPGATAVAVSEDGESLIAIDADFTIRFWQLATGAQTKSFKIANRSRLTFASFSGDGSRLTALDSQYMVHEVDVAAGKVLWRREGTSWLGATAVVLARDTVTRAKMLGLPGQAADLAQALETSPDRRWIASAGRDNTVTVSDAKTRKPLHAFSAYKGWVSFVSFAPGGKTVRTGGLDGKIRAWDALKGTCLGEFDARQERGRSVILTPDGQRLVTGDAAGHIAVWELESGKLLKRFGKHDGAIWTLALAPGGKILASAGTDRTIRLWNVDSGVESKRLSGTLAKDVHYVSFSADGATLASCGSDATIRLWDVAGGKERLAIRKQSDTVEAVVFSPDGKLLATAGWSQPLRLWNPVTGALVHEIAMTKVVMRVMFSADGRLLLAGAGEEVGVWETSTWQERCRFAGHQGPVVGLALSADGRRLLSGSSDCTALAWDVTGRMTDNALAPVKLSAQELADAWQQLAASDGVRAHRALWLLVAGGKGTVVFLRTQLSPSPPLDEKRLAQWIVDLNSERFAVRAKAAAEMDKLGPLAKPVVQRALAGPLALEARQRLERLLHKLETPFSSADDVRARRAMEVLLYLGTPEARQFLKELAAGATGPRLTEEARLSLQCLGETHSR